MYVCMYANFIYILKLEHNCLGLGWGSRFYSGGHNSMGTLL